MSYVGLEVLRWAKIPFEDFTKYLIDSLFQTLITDWNRLKGLIYGRRRNEGGETAG
jgi:hypothetical protein